MGFAVTNLTAENVALPSAAALLKEWDFQLNLHGLTYCRTCVEHRYGTWDQGEPQSKRYFEFSSTMFRL